MSSDLNLAKPQFQDPLRSKIIREDLTDIENNFNSLRDEFATSVSSTATEVTNARDNFGNVQDNIHIRKVQGDAYWFTGGVVSAQSVPDNTVRITAGEGVVSGVGADWISGTTNTLASPTIGRKDIVVINSDNTLSVETGNDGATATLPALGTTQRPLYIIAQDTAAPLTIVSGDLTEARQQGCYVNGKYYFKIQGAIDDISSGTIRIRPGNYYEEIDLTGKSNITLIGDNGANIYRPGGSSYALKSINSGGSEESGINIENLNFYGNGKAGAFELLKIQYTDEFKITGCRFDSNNSSTATYKNFVIDQCDIFILENNKVLDNAGLTDYTTSNITNATDYLEDGNYKNQVLMCNSDTETTRLLLRGWTEVTAAANRFLRTSASGASTTGGADTHLHVWYDTLADTDTDEDGAGQTIGTTGPAGGGSATGIFSGLKTAGSTLEISGGQDGKTDTVNNIPNYYQVRTLEHR